MIYYILKFTYLFGLRLFFRKLYLIDTQNIPKKGPVVLAVMHPNSFIDSFTLGIFLKRQLRFLARGDVFKTKIARILLEQMFTSPIYRAMDNAKDVKKNTETFKIYTKTLKKNGTLLMHPEGICVHEKRVRPLKKGLAKIVFGAEEENDFKLGVQIVPVSMNYTNAPKSREDSMIVFAEPIPLIEYKELYEENPAKAYQALNERMYNALVEKTIIIEEKKAEQLAEHYLNMSRNDANIPRFPLLGHDPKQWKVEKAAADHINKIFKDNNDRFIELAATTKTYFDELRKTKLYDRDFARALSNRLLRALFLITTAPLWPIGYIANILPIYLGKAFTNKVVKTVEFHASLFIGASWLFYLIYFTILSVVLIIFTGWIGILYAHSLAALGFFAVQYSSIFQEYCSYSRFLKFKKKHKDEANDLILRRKEILENIKNA